VLKITPSYHGMTMKPVSKKQKKESMEKLAEMDRLDQVRIDTAEAKNTLESYIYEVKNNMYDEEDAINEVTTEEQREEVMDMANSLDDWLYDEGSDLGAKDYKIKKKELQSLYDAIELRVREKKELPKMLKAVEKKFSDIRALVEKWNTSMPHITEEEKQDVLDLIEKQESWIAEKMQLLEEQEAHEEPKFVSTNIPGRMKTLQEMVQQLKRKPVPKPPKVPKNETASGNDTKEASKGDNDEKTPIPNEDTEENINHDSTNEGVDNGDGEINLEEEDFETSEEL